MSKPKAPRWDLDSIFPGGSESKEFAAFRKDIKTEIKSIDKDFDKLPSQLDNNNMSDWVAMILRIQNLYAKVNQAGSFVGCLVSAKTDDAKAHQIYGEIDVIDADYESLMIKLEAFGKNQTDDAWKKLVETDELKEIAFFLNRTREIARKKMAPEFEAFAAELAVNGYHAWNRLYDKMYGDLKGDFEINGETKEFSLGQLANKLSSPDRDIRRRANAKIEELWESRANETSMALNFQAGYRLTLYEKRGWSNIDEALMSARISEDTLNAMWEAVSQSADKLKQYITAKKKLLGIKNFRWYDQFAPVGASDKIYSFEQGGQLVVDKIADFSPSQAEFTKMALDKNWVEAEDRSGKGGGAFCTDFLLSKQTRVFMTYSGTYENITTLAHELGHAYHQHVVMPLSPFATIYPMTLAETASIFNEHLVNDAMLTSATEKDEKLMILDVRLQNAYILFCNIYARFLFDKQFYAERKKGLVSRERLDEIMVEVQKKAFFGTLAEDGYHPLFWASKLHFYLTDTPFYNYPYTFGYLFASGAYSRAKEEGQAFAKNYEALLYDTGRMTSEEVAQKHMGVDLTKVDFWNSAVKMNLNDVDEFVKLIG